MKKSLTLLLSCLLAITFSLQGNNSTYYKYQNYNHGYCPACHCAPCRCQGGCAGGCCPNCNPPMPRVEPVPQPIPPIPPAAMPPPCGPCQGPCDPCDSCNDPCDPCSDPCDPCDECDECCDPCAPTCGTQCGISICALGIIVVGVATAAAIIISSGNGSDPNAH